MDQDVHVVDINSSNSLHHHRAYLRLILLEASAGIASVRFWWFTCLRRNLDEKDGLRHLKNKLGDLVTGQAYKVQRHEEPRVNFRMIQMGVNMSLSRFVMDVRGMKRSGQLQRYSIIYKLPRGFQQFAPAQSVNQHAEVEHGVRHGGEDADEPSLPYLNFPQSRLQDCTWQIE